MTALDARMINKILGAAVIVSFAAVAQEPTDVLDKLRAEPTRLNWSYEAKHAGKAPEAKAIVHEELRRRSCYQPLVDYVICGGLALALQVLDPDSMEGETYLVNFVEAFLARKMPVPPIRASDEQDGAVTPEYRKWLLENGLSVAEAGHLDVTSALYLVCCLSLIGDPQLAPLFKRGLDSNSVGIVIGSVRGLALLGDKSAIPQILSALERLKRFHGAAEMLILTELRNYDSRDVDRLIEARLPAEFRGQEAETPRLKASPELRPRAR